VLEVVTKLSLFSRLTSVERDKDKSQKMKIPSILMTLMTQPKNQSKTTVDSLNSNRKLKL
jgi:hypothetical protein